MRLISDMSWFIMLGILLPLAFIAVHAAVQDQYFNQFISHQSTYTSDMPTTVLPFASEAVEALYDKNGKCFVLMTSDNIMWTSRRVPHRDKIKLEPIYGDWKRVHDFSNIGSGWKIVKAPDSIILVSSPHIYEVVLDFTCSELTSLQPRVEPTTPAWGIAYSLQVGFNALWIGSDEGLLRVPMGVESPFWQVGHVEDVPVDPPVTSLAAVEQWGVLFAGTSCVFYELRFIPPSQSSYHIHHEWIGGNIDGPVQAMTFDEAAGCLWVVEADAVHCRDEDKMWWRFGYPQGALTDNLTSVAVARSRADGRGSGALSQVWTGSQERGLVRLRVDKSLLSGDECSDGDSWSRWLLFYGPRYLPDGHVQMLVSDTDTGDDQDGKDGGDKKYVDDWEEAQAETLLVVSDKGVTWISSERWTLLEKQAAMQSFQYPRHDRNGIVAEVSLQAYGDLASYSHSPEDSDGIWTAQYAVAAAFRFSST